MTEEEARKIAIKIWEDVSDRRGFGLKVLRYDDPDIWNAIIDRWTDIIMGLWKTR